MSEIIKKSIKKESMEKKSELILRILTDKQDTNHGGSIFGGWLLAQADIAASMLATKYVQNKVVTVSVDNFIFKSPVYPVDLLDFYGEILKIGDTSITVNLKIVVIERVYIADKPYYFVPHRSPYVLPNLENKENISQTPRWLADPILACEGVFTFVAIGKDGKKKSIKGERDGDKK